MRRQALVVALLPIVFYASAEKCSWQNCPSYSENKDVLNVHLICHTHDDLGWLKTVDQYFWGSERELFAVGVQYIYNTVLDELEKDPSRRFSFAETGFLWRWMITQTGNQQQRLRKLIQNGQIEIIGGGWVQNDEAAAHYSEIVDQMGWGLRYLNDSFGECAKPKVAWQIDPFGHSKEFANLCSKFGFDALFFARMHYLEKAKRMKEQNLDFIWETSPDLKTGILTGAFHHHYSPPPGFCFDRVCVDDPIMDNKELEGYNVDEKVGRFVDYVQNERTMQRHNHIMLLMGDDFQYTNANTWYSNLDKLIKYVNEKANKTVKVFYSTPSCYVDAVMNSGVHFETKTDDLFPYATGEHSFWTGYFTSRPTFKRYIRESHAYLQLLKKLDAFAFPQQGADGTLSKLSRATSLVEHHDAITGTARQTVTDDYSKQLSIGRHQGTERLDAIVDKLTTKGSSTTSHLPTQKVCLINETTCDVSQKSADFTVTIYNAYTQPMSRVVRAPLYEKGAKVYNQHGVEIHSEVVKSFLTNQLPLAGRAPYELQFAATIQPLGFVTYFVKSGQNSYKQKLQADHKSATRRWKNLEAQETTASNGAIELTFDSNGFLKSYTDTASKMTKPLKQEYLFYHGMGDGMGQPTGAYVFRPNGTEPIAVSQTATLKIVKTEMMIEIRQIFSSWVSQVIRMEANKKLIEFQWTVGPIPKEKINPIAKEVITRFTTDINSNGVFYTDSNGRQMMKRTRYFAADYTYENTEPISANYYPITSMIYIEDKASQLTIFTDRSQGGSSLKDRQVELMVHRRAFHDDNFGVAEPLDEPGRTGRGLVATGSHFLLFGEGEEAKVSRKVLAQQIFHEPFVTFGELSTPIQQYITERKTEFSGLATSLPTHINILSLEVVEENILTLRLEHILESADDKLNSKPIVVDLTGLFSTFDIISAEELTLGANERIRQSDSDTSSGRAINKLSRKNNFGVKMSPMDIKTFRVEVRSRQ
ncbi:hypothetical protein QR680_015614 [Steinernema hermaphroditum]|uniref:Alpha-mannosidase n=1 Tax=Steinernema hermaphroditum TaxID=289476 RepID=A0AA39LKK1_9BILA|nr:hypothetical protein QR680_015614 [Steinernema hermaphroditum]